VRSGGVACVHSTHRCSDGSKAVPAQERFDLAKGRSLRELILELQKDPLAERRQSEVARRATRQGTKIKMTWSVAKDGVVAV
jgi:hypothetical protein